MDKGENLSVFCCGLCQKISLMGTILILRQQKGEWPNSDVYTSGMSVAECANGHLIWKGNFLVLIGNETPTKLFFDFCPSL